MKTLKTNTDNIAKPAVSLILLGVLKGYIKNPIGFLIKSKISFKQFRKTIELDLPGDFVDTTSFIVWIYIRLKEKIGQEKSYEIIRAAILTSGLAVQQAIFNTYLPEKIIFHRNGMNNTIPQGNKFCKFVIENKGRQ